MKLSSRFDSFRADADQLSAYLADFRFKVDYFTHWPHQDFKTLKNLVNTRIKLVLQTQGRSELTSSEEQFTLSPGSVAVIPPYCVYSVQTYEGVDSYEVFFNLHPFIREHEFLQHFGFTRILHFPDVLTSTDADALAASYDGIQAVSDGCYAQLSALLTLLFVRLIRLCDAPALPAGSVSREQYIIGKLFDLLEASPAKNVRVEELCEALHVSQSYLYRCSRDVMNCSTSQLIIRYKMRYAQMLLRNPDLSIGEVAAAIGYDPFYFSTQFKKAFLVSPSQYRRSLRSCLKNR